jgi:hypothetical protein
MPQCRDVIVPDALKGIKEVVVTHTKSKWGTIRTKERVVPTVLPKQEHSRRSLKSKNGAPPQPGDASEGSQKAERAVPTSGGADNNPYLGDHNFLFPDPAPEDSLP